MPDLSTLSPVVLAILTPYEDHLEDVKREFVALAQSVWDNEETTRSGVNTVGFHYYARG